MFKPGTYCKYMTDGTYRSNNIFCSISQVSDIDIYLKNKNNLKPVTYGANLR